MKFFPAQLRFGISLRQAVQGLLIFPLLGMAGGCYERVIDARGIGTDSVNVQKPYRSETALDKAFFPDNSRKDNGFESSGSANNFDRSYPSSTPPR